MKLTELKEQIKELSESEKKNIFDSLLCDFDNNDIDYDDIIENHDLIDLNNLWRKSYYELEHVLDFDRLVDDIKDDYYLISRDEASDWVDDVDVVEELNISKTAEEESLIEELLKLKAYMLKTYTVDEFVSKINSLYEK